MSLERARRIAAERLAAELGIDPEALVGASPG